MYIWVISNILTTHKGLVRRVSYGGGSEESLLRLPQSFQIQVCTIGTLCKGLIH